jgi:hypothetical protein
VYRRVCRETQCLEVFVVVGEGDSCCTLELFLVGLELLRVVLHLRGQQSEGLDELAVGVSCQLAGNVKEWLLEVVVAFCGDIVVLEVLFAVEVDILGLDLSVFAVHLVPAENNGDVLANANQVLVPVGNILVCDTSGHVEDDDSRLATDVIAITETAELFLTSSVPAVEDNVTQVCGKGKWVNFNTHGGHVLFLELASHVTLDKSGLSNTTIADQNKFELGDVCVSLRAQDTHYTV